MKQQYKCSICGQENGKSKRVNFCYQYGDFLCNKHELQLRKYGCFTDTISRGVFDPNEFRIVNNIVEIDCFDQHNNKTGTGYTDIEFFDIVKNHKWRIIKKKYNHLYIVTGNSQQGNLLYLHQLILGKKEGYEIDHIDGNPLNNCKANLRYVSRNEQLMNMSPKVTNKLGIRGVCYDTKHNDYCVDFIMYKKRLYVRHSKTLPEAVYIRYLLETKLNPFRRDNPKMEEYITQLTEEQKQEIEEYIDSKIQKYNFNL